MAARGKPSGRLVTYVPYSPSSETPDEGATNGRLTGIESVRSQVECGWPLRLVWLWSDHDFDRHLSLATERRLTAESLF